MAIGFDIVIPDALLKKITDADNKLKQLGKTANDTQTAVNNAFKQMVNGDLDAFIKKLQLANTEMAKLGNAKIQTNATNTSKSIDEINKLITALNKLSTTQKKTSQGKKSSNSIIPIPKADEWNNLQKSIQQSEKRIQELTRSTREYEATLKRIQSGKSGVLSTQDQKQYAANKAEIDALNKSIALQRQKQQEIIAQNKAIQEQNRMYAELRKLEENRKSLPNQRKDNELKEMNAYYRNLEKESRKRAEREEKEFQKRIERNRKEAEATEKAKEREAKAAEKAAKRREDAERRVAAQELKRFKANTPKDASYLLNQKGNAKSLNELKAYANELKRTMNTLDPKSKQWGKLNKVLTETNGKIKNIENSMRGFQQQSERARGIAEQLRRSLMLMFSLSQISGYIRKLVAVRGEFELQKRSLEAILQNKDAANEIWDKTVQLAVKSPFQLKELVTYTKQLAAYRVESEKLHDTTKMLADVSAGVGVDMQRLILAYGQVKAANYLRGTELRQFSEAGINILGELATYFSEIEDRAVSVGEVFQRVSNRMVSFADVEEIFKRITSEGGVFYNMQEIQAETLKGMISNLKDSLDIAINDIGESNEDTLKGAIRLVRRLIENWEDYQSLIIGIGSGLALKGLLNVIRAIGTSIMGIINGLKEASFGGITSVVAMVLSAVIAIATHVSKAKREAKELSKIELTGVSQAGMMAAEYEKLANIVTDTSKTFDEQQKALNTLKRKYDEILPSHLLEAEAIRALNGDYKDATRAINEYIAAKTKEKQLQYIEDEYGGDVTQRGEDLVSRLYKNIIKKAPSIKRSDLNIIIGQLQKEIEQGLVERGKEGERLSEMLEQALGLKINEEVWKKYSYTTQEVGPVIETVTNYLDDFVYSIIEKNQKIEEVASQSLWEDMVYRDMNAIKDRYEELKNSIGIYYDTIKKYLKGDNSVSENQYNNAISTLNSFFEKVGQEAPKWNEIINDPIRLRKATVDANKALWEDMMAEIVVNTQDASETTRDAFLEILDNEQIAFAGNKLQQEVIRVLTYLSDTMNIPLTSGMGQLLASDTESKDEYAKRVVELIDSYKAAIKQYEIDTKKNAGFSIYDSDQIEQMKKSLPLLERYKTYFFLENTKDTSRNIFEERLRILKEMYDAYKNLNKTFDETKSKEGVFEKYGQAFKEAYGFDAKEWGDFFINDNAYNVALNKLKNLAKDAKDRLKVELESGRVTLDLEIKLQKEKDQEVTDQISKMFDDYESLLELDKLGISGEFAKKYFGITTTNLAQIRKKIEDELAVAEAQGGREDFIAERKKELKKVTEMEVNAQEERLKIYLKYTRDAISERAKIEFDGMRKMAEVRETFDKDDPRLEKALEGVEKEMKAQLQALDWKEFSSSDTFVSIFNDLENVSTQALTSMIDQLEKYKEEWTNLPIDQMEAVAKQLERMKNARDVNEAVANPFMSGAFANGQLKAEDISKAQQDMISADESILASNQQISNAEYLLQLLNEEQNLKDQSVVKGLELAKLGINYTQTTKEQKEILEKVIKNEQKNVNTQKQNKKNAQGTLDLAEKQKAVLEAQSKYLGEGLQMANDLYDAFSGLYEALGGDKDNPVAIFADMGMNMANTVIQTIQLQIQLNIAAQSATGLGVAMNAAMGVIGWIVMAVQLLTTALSAIAKAHDNALQKQIERDAEAVELLQKRFEKLEKAIDNAMSFGEYEKEFDEAKRSLEEQIRLTEDMIALEEAKKKTDKDAIKGYKDDIEGYNEQLKEIEEKRIEDMGGFGSDEAYKDAAQSFIDAWLSAYKETGDGLEALQGQWDEYFDNLVKKQMTMHIANKYIKGLLEQVDEAIGEDGIVTGDEMANLRAMAEQSSIELNAIMKQFADAFGIEGLTDGTKLEGLSESIQGVTEVTAQALEAILNSMRFYVIDNNKQLIDIANTLLSWESPTSPILAELKAQTNYLSSIESLFNSVVDRNGSPAVRVR